MTPFALPCPAPALRRAMVAAALCAPIAAPVALQAQDSATGGRQLTFGLALGVEAEDNRALDPDPAGTSSTALARLSLGLLDETRVARASLSLDGTLRALDGPGSGSGGIDLVDPGLALDYERSGTFLRLGVAADLRETDLASTEPAETASGSATRRQSGLELRLDSREEAAAGLGLFARIEATEYDGGTATGLDGTPLGDTRRRGIGLSGWVDFDPVTRLDLDLVVGDFHEDGRPGRRGTVALEGQITRDRPLGALTAGFGITGTEEGERVQASLGRVLELPRGELRAEIGAARGSGGETFFTAALDLRHDLPAGSLSFGLSRDITSSDEDDSERLTTRAEIGYAHELSPLDRISLNLDWQEAEQTATGLQTVSASLEATYSRELTEDWTLDAGYRHRYRDADTGAEARSNKLFLELRRSFVTRF